MENISNIADKNWSLGMAEEVIAEIQKSEKK